jgi:6-phosphogluconolactonase
MRIYLGNRGPGETFIRRLRLDPAAGRLAAEGEPTPAANPSFIALHPSGRFLYAVDETGMSRTDPGGAVAALAVDPETGALRPLNRQPSGGASPLHLAFDAAGRHLFVSNYWGGSVAVLPIAPDGTLGPASALVRHEGGATAPGRDPGPHAHSLQLDEAGRFAVVADLGRDELLVYRFDPDRGTLARHEPGGVAMAPGAGPRHFVFHPDGRHGYVVNELDSTVTLLAYEPATGRLTAQQTLTTLPAGVAGSNAAAEIAVSPDGRFLYASNRGHDSLAIYAIAPGSRTLAPVGHQPTFGRTPRHFAIDPSGRHLVVANQDSDSVVLFAIDRESGRLAALGSPLTVSRPFCVVLAQGID